MRLTPLLMLALSMAVIAQEKQIPRSALPPAVEKTVAAQPGATRGFSEEKEHGQTFYEAQMMVEGHSKDILMDASGAIVEVEEQVAFDALPEPIKKSLTAKAGKGRITKVESVIKHDKLAAYEAQVTTNGKHSEIKVGPEGQEATEP